MLGHRDWEDPQVVGTKQTAGSRPDGGLYQTRTGRVDLRPGPIAVRALINGAWRFHLAPTQTAPRRDFHREGMRIQPGTEIDVPGNWQLQGFDDNPIYTNVAYPFHPIHRLRPKKTRPDATAGHSPSRMSGRGGV